MVQRRLFLGIVVDVSVNHGIMSGIVYRVIRITKRHLDRKDYPTFVDGIKAVKKVETFIGYHVIATIVTI